MSKGAVCPEDELGKDQVSLGLPGERTTSPPNTSATRPALTLRFRSMERPCFNPENAEPPGDQSGAFAPCPSGYLIGWVINPITQRPIKYDGLTGNAVLRDDSGAIAVV